jgi:preprotein translocase subunit SecF
MELFKDTNFDFLGKKWPFIIASLVLTVAGLASIVMKGGLKYGIDFKGGAQMRVKFASTPQVEKIRAAMGSSDKIRGEVTVTNFKGVGVENEVEIATELQDESQLNINRQAMQDVLTATFGGASDGKLDFNNAGQAALVERLREPLMRAGNQLTEQQLKDLVQTLLSYRDNQASGLVTDFNQLSSAPGVNAGIINTLRQETYLAPFHIMQVQMVGPKVGADLRSKAIWATLYALGGMLVYIGFRFEWIYGLGAVLAVLHDTVVTVGLFSIFNEEISMTVIAALLTLVGYSMNDTIVIFDRVRENLKLSRRDPLDVVINRSINQTLGRTVMTSGLTFLSVLALFIWGGPVLHGFSFALVCGIIVGTYSTVFIANPVILAWYQYADKRKPRTAVVTPDAKPAARTSAKPDAERKRPTKAVK